MTGERESKIGALDANASENLYPWKTRSEYGTTGLDKGSAAPPRDEPQVEILEHLVDRMDIKGRHAIVPWGLRSQ